MKEKREIHSIFPEEKKSSREYSHRFKEFD